MTIQKIAFLGLLLAYCAGLSAQPGSPDPAFGRVGITTANIYTGEDQAFGAVRRPDGRLLVVGSAMRDSVRAFAAMQLLPNGDPDPAFDLDGKMVRSAAGPGEDIAYAVALYPDGRALLAGIGERPAQRYDFALMRLLPDGQPDSTFGKQGRVLTDFDGGDDFAYAVMLQPDGKIIAAGHTSPDGAESDFAIARYLSNGDPDSTFGVHGKLVQSVDVFSEVIYDALLQPDGKILVAGNIYDFAFEADYIIGRYLPDGTPDPNFGDNGIVTLNFDSSFDLSRGIALQPDGKIIAAGFSSVDFISQVSAARLLPGGAPDSTFGANGKVLQAVGDLGSFSTDVAVQPDGKLLLSGMTEDLDARDIFVLRLQPNGMPDSTFGDNGLRISSVSDNDDNSYALALEPNGHIFLAGRSDNFEQADVTVLRYSPAGNLDPAFGSGGVVRTDNGSSYDQASAMLILPDDAIVIGGYSRQEVTAPMYINSTLLRYQPDGRLDKTFGDAGILSNNLTPSTDRWEDLAVFPDGGIVLCAGQLDNQAGLAAYRPDGLPVSTFGNAGLVQTQLGPGSIFRAIAVQPNGKILAAGQYDLPEGKNILQRFGPDGLPDLSFGQNGATEAPLGPLSSQWTELLVAPDGMIITAGQWFTDTAAFGVVARFLPNGVPDTTFGKNGLFLDPSPVGSGTHVDVIALLPGGKLLVAGGYEDFSVIRLLPDGTPDPAFGNNGRVAYDFGQMQNSVTDLAVQADGRIVLAGRSLPTAGTDWDERFVVLRLDPGGSLDPTFGQNGMVHLRGLIANRVGLQQDGNIVAAGVIQQNIPDNKAFYFQNDVLLVRLLTGPALGIADSPDDSAILMVYPNPVGETLQVEYELQADQRVTARLFDAAGQSVGTLMSEVLRKSGKHRESLRLPASLTPGMYSLVLEAGAGRRALWVVKS